jgi:hypothetical protein
MAEPTQELTEYRSFPKSLPNFGLSRKAYHTLHRPFLKSLPNVNISKRARRISALAEEVVDYRVGPYPNTMRNIDHSCARIFRPSFRENKPKSLVFRKRALVFAKTGSINSGTVELAENRAYPKSLQATRNISGLGLTCLTSGWSPRTSPSNKENRPL